MCSSPDPSSIQESGLAGAACTAGGHSVSCPPPTPVLLPLPAPPAAPHCGWSVHHPHTAVCMVRFRLWGLALTSGCSAENTTLRLIQGLSSPEFLLQLAKLYASDPKPVRPNVKQYVLGYKVLYYLNSCCLRRVRN